MIEARIVFSFLGHFEDKTKISSDVSPLLRGEDLERTSQNSAKLLKKKKCCSQLSLSTFLNGFLDTFLKGFLIRIGRKQTKGTFSIRQIIPIENFGNVMLKMLLT